jgi:catechol 2,3-dioxygenase
MAPTLPAETTLGAVVLTVADLERSLAYWRDEIGLEVQEQRADRATLGVPGTPLLVLEEVPGAPPADGYSGLFHVALLVPERADLARWLAHAARDRVQLTGASDHDVSEALYLRDPDHHGIEIYADRPRALWEGEVGQRLTTLPLDVDALLGELDDPVAAAFDGLPAGTRIGHVHLRVADVPEAVRFYRDLLGFELMASLGAQAAFLAAGGYHHHIGANTWESRGRPPAPPGSATLRRATIVLPTAADRDAAVERVRAGGAPVEEDADGTVVRDPSGNALLLVAA